MAPDNVTKSPVVEAEEKTTTEMPAVEVVDQDVEKTKTGKEPQVEKSTELIEEQKVAVPLDETKTKEVEPIVIEKTIPDTKEEIAEAVAEIIRKNNADEVVVVKEEVPDVGDKKQDEPNVGDDEKKEKDPVVCEKQAVPANEIDMKKDAEIEEKKEEKPKDECANENIEPLKIEDVVKKDDEATENGKQGKTVEAHETEENRGTNEMKDPAKTESKEEKTVDETKLTDSTTKEEEKASPKQSISLIGKVKKSFWKAKKAITGKNNANDNDNAKTSETKEDDKA